MKKVKELLIFLVLLLLPILVFLIFTGISADLLSNNPSFVGLSNYIRLFINDKLFVRAFFNTLAMPVAISVLIASAFALIMFLLRKKVKLPRFVFYLGCVLFGGITTLIYLTYVNIAMLGVPSQLYAAQTIVTHIVDYSPSLFGAITIPNVLFSLYIGIFTAFIFWIVELIIGVVKNIKRKRKNNEKIEVI